MSIAEQSGSRGHTSAEPWEGSFAPYAAEEYAAPGSDRMPPQDHAAEQSVIGSMLLSKDAIADVVESIRGTDFYRPAHETIFDAVIDLYGRGEPVDPVTTSAELSRRGELVKVGGAPYLHTLSASVPIAANASYYAEIVREKAILRRLVSAGTRIVQMGYAGEGMVDDTVDAAQQEVYQVTDKRTSRGLRAAERDHGGHARRDRGDLEPRRRDDRGADRLRRPRRADQRHARRSDDHHRRASRGREGAGARHRAAHADRAGPPWARSPSATSCSTPRATRRGWWRRREPMLRRPCYRLTFSDGSDDRGRLAAPVGHPRRGRLPSATGSGVSTVTTGELARTIEAGHTIAMPDGASVKVESVVPVETVPVRCVQVDNDAHLYLAGADRASRPTTRRWPWTCAGPRASTTTRPRSSSASR